MVIDMLATFTKVSAKGMAASRGWTDTATRVNSKAVKNVEKVSKLFRMALDMLVDLTTTNGTELAS